MPTARRRVVRAAALLAAAAAVVAAVSATSAQGSPVARHSIADNGVINNHD
jgi:hypothetical protein